MFSTLNAFEFQKHFTDTNSCLKYLADLKWKMDSSTADVVALLIQKATFL